MDGTIVIDRQRARRIGNAVQTLKRVFESEFIAPDVLVASHGATADALRDVDEGLRNVAWAASELCGRTLDFLERAVGQYEDADGRAARMIAEGAEPRHERA